VLGRDGSFAGVRGAGCVGSARRQGQSWLLRPVEGHRRGEGCGIRLHGSADFRSGRAFRCRLREGGSPVPGGGTSGAFCKFVSSRGHQGHRTAHRQGAADGIRPAGARSRVPVVFGSGGARQVPEGFSKQEAFEQLVDFGKRIAPEARSRNITIAIEPLRHQESNIINTAAEGLQWVNAVNDPNIQLMIDYYHFQVEKEDLADIFKVKDHLRHLHMANPNGRVVPLQWEEYDYAPFFADMRAIHYDRLISVEASTKDLRTEGPQAIALLRRAFAQ
jgi:sugar phosphate isomerase/epimerase